jgi:multisubunit Na+/H+ antiporter MnhB subunit
MVCACATVYYICFFKNKQLKKKSFKILVIVTFIFLESIYNIFIRALHPIEAKRNVCERGNQKP